MNKLIYDDEKLINSANYDEKAEKLIKDLEESIFKDITKESVVDITDTGKSKKKVFKANEIMPMITPMKVNLKLAELLSEDIPMNLQESRSLEPSDYLRAFRCFCRVNNYINEYIVYIPSKQLFCSFCNITTDIYNELLTDTFYERAFNKINDYIIDFNFTASQSGLTDNKTTLTKLQTRDAGHNLMKNADIDISTKNDNSGLQELERQLMEFKEKVKLLPKK